MSVAHRLVQRYKGTGDLVDLFGLILYTDANPNLVKVLNDEQYWKSFNIISGTRWLVLSARIVEGHREVPQMQVGALGSLVPAWLEPPENKALLEEFGLETSRDLPLLLLFTWDQDTKQVLQLRIEIKDDTVDVAQKAVREVICRVTEVIERTDPKYRNNAQELIALVDTEELSVKARAFLRKAVPFAKWIAKLING